MALTDRQEKFVNHYFVHMNAYQAALAAGYSERTAHGHSHELLKKVEIKARLDELRAERTARANIEADELLDYVAELYRGNPRDFYKWDGDTLVLKPSDELTDAQMRTIQAVEYTTTHTPTRNGEVVRNQIKLKHYSRKDALDMAMRHKALYNDKLNMQQDTDVRVSFRGLPSKPSKDADRG